jgi:hypothetical protein
MGINTSQQKKRVTGLFLSGMLMAIAGFQEIA